MFLQHNTVLFDKDKNQMGFIENYVELDPFIDDDNIIYVFDAVQVGLVLSGLAICLLQNYKK